MNKKAVALISGGLDSVLAAKVVMEQGFDVTGLYFTSAFSKTYGQERETHAASSRKRSASISASRIWARIILISFGLPCTATART